MAYLLMDWAAASGTAVAMVDEGGKRHWAELNARVNRLIRLLRAAGLEVGDRIVIFAGNSMTYFEIMIAAHHSGISYVPANWHLTAEELAYLITDSQAKAVFTDTRFAATARSAVDRLDPTSSLLLQACFAAPGLGTTDAGRLNSDDDPCSVFADLEALVVAQPDDSEPTDQAVGGPMFYTSGTTGKPKGVVRTVAGPPAPIESLRTFTDGLMNMLGLPRRGVTLLAGPVYHSAQWSFSFAPLLAGSRLVMTHRFDAETTLSLIDSFQVSNVHLVPTQFLRLLRLPDEVRTSFQGRSLARVWHGAAPCPPDVKRAMIKWWGPCIHEYYGSTEGAIVTGISAEEWLQRPGSVGRVIGPVEVSIVSDDGRPANIGDSGTIYMRNLRPIGLRYHNDEDKTQAAHRAPGQFTTGDVGWMDAQGYLYLTDRKIDMIISGGVNIYPAEIEAVLASHPAVQDVAVIGVPNVEFGEEVKALVEVLPGVPANPSLAGDLTALCRDRLAGYKVPRSIEFRSGLPRTETGKLQKRLLRDPYWHGTGRRI